MPSTIPCQRRLAGRPATAIPTTIALSAESTRLTSTTSSSSTSAVAENHSTKDFPQGRLTRRRVAFADCGAWRIAVARARRVRHHTGPIRSRHESHMTQHSRLGLASSLASLTLISASAAAQSVTRPPANGQQPLEEIVGKATKIERPLDHVPSAASVVGQDDIQYARQQLGLDEALNRVPGMFMQNRYNFAQDLRISIRGFGARAQFGIRGVKVLVDGIPETLPDGQGAVDSLDLGAMSSVEVLRGPSSAIYA